MNYNVSILHYMAIYDKGTNLLSYFSGLEDTQFQDFLKYKESFGSNFLHSAAGRNNVEFLSNIFEGKLKQVMLEIVYPWLAKFNFSK